MIKFGLFCELFDKPLDHKYLGADKHGAHTYSFKHGSDEYHVNINHFDKHTGEIDGEKRNGEAEFYKHTPGKDPDFKASHDKGKDAHKIIGTVAHIMKKHAKEHDLESMHFASDDHETGRAKLYKKLVQKHGGTSDEHAGHHFFEIPAGKK